MDEKLLKEALQQGLKEFKEEIKKTVDETVKTTIEEKTKDIDERLEKIEKLPITNVKFNINKIPSTYKGYNLSHQLEKIRKIAGKRADEYPVFSDDEKAEDWAKFLIAFIKFKKHQDISALADIQAIQAKAQLQEGTDSEGGYLVPDEYAWEIAKLARAKSFALNQCTVINMGTDTLKLPAEASLVSVAWTDEEGGITESEPTFGQVQLTAKRLDGYAKVTNELLQDSNIDIVGLLTEQFSYAIGLELDNQVLNGTGSPVSGVLTAKAGYSVVMGSGETNFSSISADDLSNMIAKIDEGYADDLLFIFNKLIMHYIRILKDDNSNYIYAKPGNGVPGTVWEYPYFQSAKAPKTTGASTAFVALGNFKYFYIGRRVGSMALDVDPYGLFTTNATRFRIVTRWGLAVAMVKAFCRLITAAS